MIPFAIYYDDGSVYREKNAPARGVQVIVMPNLDGGIQTQTGTDYYVFDQRAGDKEPRWYGCDQDGLTDFLERSGIVKFGRTLNSKAYRNILDTALKTEFDE